MEGGRRDRFVIAPSNKLSFGPLAQLDATSKQKVLFGFDKQGIAAANYRLAAAKRAFDEESYDEKIFPHQIALDAAIQGQPTPTDTLSGVFQPYRPRLMQAARIASTQRCRPRHPRTPPTGRDAAPSHRRDLLPEVSCPAGGRRRIPAAFRPAGVRPLPEVRLARTRVCAGQVRRLPSRAPGALSTLNLRVSASASVQSARRHLEGISGIRREVPTTRMGRASARLAGAPYGWQPERPVLRGVCLE